MGNVSLLTFVSFVLPVVGQFIYLVSLEGGGPNDADDWLDKNLRRLTALVFLSTVTFTLALCISVWHKSSVKSILWTLFCLSLLVVVTNHGSTVQQHGAYNLLGFFFFFLPEIFIVSVMRCSFSFFRTRVFLRYKRVLLAVGVVLLLFFSYILLSSSSNWGDGLFARKMEPSYKACPISYPVISWDQIYESTIGKAYSYWAWRRCPAVPQFSTPSSNNTVTIDCPADRSASYTVLPLLEGRLGRFMGIYVQERTVVNKYNGPFPLETDAAIATCGADHNVHITCNRNPDVIERLTSPKNGHQHSPSPLAGAVPNIIFVFVDAVSRSAWHRKFSSTLAFLEGLKNSPNAEVFQFLRFHSIAHKTRDNSRAMFTGNIEDPFATIWELIDDKYVTGIVDNTCHEWSANYLFGRSSIADHRLNSLWCTPEYNGNGRMESYNLLRGPWSAQRRCIAGQLVHDLAFKYANLFLDAYKDQQKFLLLKFTEGHEPTGMIVGMLDDPLATFLSTLDFNTTALIMVSDHGLHMGPLFSFGLTSQLESLLPGWFMVLPKWWLGGTRSQILMENEQALVSPYNIFATVLEIAGFDIPTKVSTRSHFAQSVASHNLVANSCLSAGIPQHLCLCEVHPSTNLVPL
ncbi:type I phosphodiesterase/nucleotide pyrophosphatase [Pelomyxa schiedti]|nr:type I phosphodiesterase/nucleotide pyrophosphatase [Pelomyxa schiedti]